VRRGDGDRVENGGAEVLRRRQQRSGAHRRSVKGPAAPEMMGEGEALIFYRGRARQGGAHRRDEVAAAPQRKIGGGRRAPAERVDEWCCGGTREGWRRSGGADSQRRKCAVGHSTAIMLKQRGEKGGSGGLDALPLEEGKVGVWRSTRHAAGEGGGFWWLTALEDDGGR
jgi:hypothetical protein